MLCNFTSFLYRMGWKWMLSAMSYGEGWKERRRLLTKHISAANAPSLQPVQFEFTHRMLVQLLDKPEDFLAITRQ